MFNKIGYDLRMARKSLLDTRRVRDEIAVAAARLIAEDGLDYATAKRKAVRQLIGDVRVTGEQLPDNGQIQDEIRKYQALFQAHSQPAWLRALRKTALDWMTRLAQFRPYLTGAVLNGTASNYSDIHLQLFHDNPKDVAIFLLNAGIPYEVLETRHFGGHCAVETLSFIAHRADSAAVGIYLALYEPYDLRSAQGNAIRGQIVRANAQAVAALLANEIDIEA